MTMLSDLLAYAQRILSIYMGGCQNCCSFSWIPIKIRHLIFRVPKRGHNFDSHPYRGYLPKPYYSFLV